MNNIETSIKTIEKAIKTAKAEKTDAYYYYILWGTILFIYFLFHYLAIDNVFIQSKKPDQFLWIIFPLGGVLSVIQKKKNKVEELKVVSNHEKVYFFAFTGFALMYVFTMIHSMMIMYNYSIVIFPLLLGVTVFVIGGITKNNISIIAGLISTICSIISLMSSEKIHYLMAAIAAFISCIFVGIIMKMKNA